MTDPRTLVLLSGGLDSTVLLAIMVNHSGADSVGTLSVNYGQRHGRELESARQVAAHYGVGHDVLDLTALAPKLGSALTGLGDVPHGHYSSSTMAATVVPNRNAIMLMSAVGVAAANGFAQVMVAVHAGDHPIYPDCRPEFIVSASETARLGTDGYGSVTIAAPFVNGTKADIVHLGDRLSAPMGLSWSCYEGGTDHCGRCGTCVERAEAFHLAGVEDPTTYADPAYWRKVTA